MRLRIQLFHFKYRTGLAYRRKGMPNGSGFQTSDDSSHRDMGLNFEPRRNSVFFRGIELAFYASSRWLYHRNKV